MRAFRCCIALASTMCARQLSDDALHLPIACVLVKLLPFKIYIMHEWFWWLIIFFTPKYGFLKFFFTSKDKILETTSVQLNDYSESDLVW